MDISKLPYRPCVSCIVFKGNKFLVVQNIDWVGFWKFPQGGVNENETDEKAVRRELLEELGSRNFKIVAKSKQVNQYDWTDDILRLFKTKKWRGQLQKFFLVEFLGEENEIIIDKKELKGAKWVEKKDLAKHLKTDHPSFKNYYSVIEKILVEFNL